MKPEWSHLSDAGRVRMVDVGGKAPSCRTARAEAVVHLGRPIAALLRKTGSVAKGNAMETARLAGILAAKRTAELIPLCHAVPLDVVRIDLRLEKTVLRIESWVKCRAATGVEMEALIGVSVAALTVYDMCKSAGKGIVVRSVRLAEKTGGRSGVWRRKG